MVDAIVVTTKTAAAETVVVPAAQGMRGEAAVREFMAIRHEFLNSLTLSDLARLAAAQGHALVPVEASEEALVAAQKTPGMRNIDECLVFAAMHGMALRPARRTPLDQAYRAMIAAGRVKP